ncbi:FIG00449997: hypothetical protein [hydrothermal vent metagenome]|uniref:VWA domain-containing protein n=1 Tax=hydrothermal vent metagenome TaxID=652676 RepID=A0A3B0RGG5_9ZZZZ
MFLHFFSELRAAKVPVSMREYLMLIEALDGNIIRRKVDDFYYLSRAALVKDERNLDKFDLVFGKVFEGVESVGDLLEEQEIPEEWLRKLTEKYLSEEEKAEIEALGGWDKLMETLAERLKKQEKRHQGGNKMIGTAGTSPFGAHGYNPEGVRIGQDKGRHGRAVKVWDKRQFKNLDGDRELGTRNIKLALRRLRKLARDGHPDELDLSGTIDATAKQGWLDILMRPERTNTIKVALFLDVGGSMDPFVEMCEELFSAARTEFKRLDSFYFHNCLYEAVWKDNFRRRSEVIPTWDLLHKHPSDTKIIFVGDASMSPYEISVPGGSVEHWNEEAGAVWLQRVNEIYDDVIWLNPTPQQYWDHTASISIIQDILGPNRMFPLTLKGIDAAMRELGR